RADEADGKLASLQEQVAGLEKARKDQAEAESQVRALKAKLEQAEAARIDAENPDRLRKAVSARTRLATQAATVLGGACRFDTLTDREVMVTVLERLGKTPGKDDSDAYIKGRFDIAVEQYAEGERALDSLRSMSMSRNDVQVIDT